MQRLTRVQRIMVFVLIFGGGLFLLIGVFWFLAAQSLNSSRPSASALADGVSVSELAALPDSDAYPPTVVVRPDGVVITGSYATGTLWAIAPDGAITVLERSREEIGAVTGLAVRPDGGLLVVDQIDTDPRTGSGNVKLVAPDGSISLFADLSAMDGFLVPDDVAIDSAERVYVTDRGRGEVWRFEADGSGALLWWEAPETPDGRLPAPTGIAYDAANNALLISDSDSNVIYRVPVSDGPAEQTQEIYRHSGTDAPGFDGLVMLPDGQISVAALGLNRVALIDLDGTIRYIAGGFRGAADVDYDPRTNRLLVANWDQVSLVAGALLQPRLPFGIDAIQLPE